MVITRHRHLIPISVVEEEKKKEGVVLMKKIYKHIWEGW